MDANKSITVRIAPQDLEILKRGNLKLIVGRPVGRSDGPRVVWKTLHSSSPNIHFRWDEDYTLHAAAPEGMAAAGGTVALWFGQHAEPGAIVDPSGVEAILIDVSADDSAAVTYSDGRWARMNAE